ncbi:protein-L-isoaspartate O-methyltransferase family protein [Francisella adeliensis]|uniref:Protein-L-isoaspartate O-methyltransferase n=1 Tax=Francisella adeliensis TaxID=2007306 RepID=A0A2Z4Y0E6_9GAMM|nr:protein-L-isoaspartate O-methyltransferase [Francisella adeliensis]AXA34534.1 protein-L-isoaspartate O-methyltransferase [Francisella adeliensis]MBK2086257.1 protein-L-isoaspartate O-methyltransferase [Francisella adeliensis]MBK2096474.1 protein-L-isoaspartate O-methyltransferase [Francisella adeliensis]QIW12781.1 protein-L-isoaspartate O-methyltransferase [Francisella adeliensis]QIW14659.1 protein-L-isoaspartate O-methyltransferase [Francisella adeliensis]
MNFEFARENMIKQQVMPEGIAYGSLIEAMSSIAREDFLPHQYKNLAYCDTNLVLGSREIKSPMLTAKLLNSLEIRESDDVLMLGVECGYTAALLAKISNSVEILDYSDDMLGQTRRSLASLNIFNAEFNNAEHLTNIIENDKKYDCVFITSAVQESDIDESLLQLLDLDGRMVFVVQTNICNKAYLLKKTSADEYDKKFLFDIYNK